MLALNGSRFAAQVWQPRPIEEPEDELPDQGQQQEITGASRPAAAHDDTGPDEDQSGAATRITLRPHDPGTGDEVEKNEVVKGYEHQRGQFVTFTPEELKALDVESLRGYRPGEICATRRNRSRLLQQPAVDTFKARTVTRPTPVIDLMTALKRSLAQDSPAPKRSRGRNRRRARHRCRKTAKAGLMLVLSSPSNGDSVRLRKANGLQSEQDVDPPCASGHHVWDLLVIRR